MKKFIFGILLMISLIGSSNAETVSHVFKFNEHDFEIKHGRNDSVYISSIASVAIYPDITNPAIPILGRNLAFDSNESITGFTYNYSKRLLCENIHLMNAPQPIPTNIGADKILNLPTGYQNKIYPDSNCMMRKGYQLGGINVVSFLICPFIYDATSNKLYFIDSLSIQVRTQNNGLRKAPAKINTDQIEMLYSVIENKEVISRIPMNFLTEYPDEYYEYIIITSNSFKDSFNPLSEWKRKKGVPSKIISIEDINQSYTGRTQQIKIKSCIKDYFENHGTKFVLLGGDIDIIPAQYCYVSTHGYDADIPADVYYSALADLDWDVEKQQFVGDPQIKKVDIVPSIYVTRAPVRTNVDVETFVNRTIEYEKTPKTTKTLFQAGSTMGPNVTGKALADLLYNNVFVGKIVIGNQQLFDTYTDNGKQLSLINFRDELAKGYQFTEIICHGNETQWSISGSKPFFNDSYASILNNVGHTMLTTTACLTNAFDQDETGEKANPCLSEALFRNPQSGIIGYLGSSRYGWYNGAEPDLSCSMAYEKDFYERLFDRQNLLPYEKNFGALVCFIKHTHLGLMNNELIYNWLHYSINAIGDPETPIFNTTPLQNSTATATVNLNGELIIDTGVDDARVCVSSANDDTFYEIGFGRNLTFQPGTGSFDIWITKQNMIPKHFYKSISDRWTIIDQDSIPEMTLNSQIVSISPNPATDIVTIKYFANAIDVKISLININTGQSFIFDPTENKFEMTIDVSNLTNGIYSVNLIENGSIITGNDKLIKK